MRRELSRDMKEANFEENLVKSIVLLAREMSWTVDYIMEMDVRRFIGVSKVITEFYREQNQQAELQNTRNMIR